MAVTLLSQSPGQGYWVVAADGADVAALDALPDLSPGYAGSNKPGSNSGAAKSVARASEISSGVYAVTRKALLVTLAIDGTLLWGDGGA